MDNWINGVFRCKVISRIVSIIRWGKKLQKALSDVIRLGNGIFNERTKAIKLISNIQLNDH